MKLMIASDIHGSAFYCKKLLEAFKSEHADKILLLGDILYHGPRNDLPEGYAPKKVIAMLNERKADLLCVRGNCDTEVDQMVLEFPILAEYALLYLEGKQVFVTHGHKFNTANPPALQNGDVLLHGHTHVQIFDDSNGYVYMNPGSVSLPKENKQKSYMVYEDGVFTVKSLENGTDEMSYSIK